MTLPLSKSEYMQARSCSAKLYYRRMHFSNDTGSNTYLRLLAHGGYMVDALARAKYPDGSAMRPTRDPSAAAALTRERLKEADVTLFEATVLAGRRVARPDILVKRGSVIDLIEVKSKGIDGAEHAANIAKGGRGILQNAKKAGVSAKWREKLEDVTYQTLVLERMMPGVTVRPFLLLVDNSKRTMLDNVPALFRVLESEQDGTTAYRAEFIGDREQLDELDLLTLVDVASEVSLLRAEVDAAASVYESMLDQPFAPAWRAIGSQCRDCEFTATNSSGDSGFRNCWGELAGATPHLLELMNVGQVKTLDGKPLVESLFAEGKAGLFDITIACLAKSDMTWGPLGIRQRRQIEHMQSGLEWMVLRSGRISNGLNTRFTSSTSSARDSRCRITRECARGDRCRFSGVAIRCQRRVPPRFIRNG